MPPNVNGLGQLTFSLKCNRGITAMHVLRCHHFLSLTPSSARQPQQEVELNAGEGSHLPGKDTVDFLQTPETFMASTVLSGDWWS